MKFHLVLLATVCLLFSADTWAQSFPPAFSKTATYAAGDIVQYGGNWYRAMNARPADGPYPASAYGYWELNYVRSNTTLTIGDGQGFANLVYAWQFARNARIADAAYLHLAISTADGAFTEKFTAPFSLDHGSGALISILGENSADISLQFPSSNGFVLDTGHSFGTLSGITLDGPGLTYNYQGISALSGAVLATVVSSNIENYVSAFFASQNAFLGVSNGVTFQNCNTAITADFGATVIADYLQIVNFETSFYTLIASHGSKISMERGEMENATMANGSTAASADTGANIELQDADISGYVYAIYVTHGGSASAEGATFKNNSFDAVAETAGWVDLYSSTHPDETSTGSDDGSYIWL
jgi:hypothetical protein